KAEFERGLRNADSACGGLDAGAFESLHELLEALTFFAAEKVFCLHFEIIKTDFKFLHAAIAEHFDLAAGHALRREGVCIIAARLFCEQHGEALVAWLVIGAAEKRHHIGAGGMGDPCLVAGDLVNIPLAATARLEACKVGAGIGFGENSGGKDLTACDLREPMRLLLRRTATKNEFCRNFRARAKRADA